MPIRQDLNLQVPSPPDKVFDKDGPGTRNPQSLFHGGVILGFQLLGTQNKTYSPSASGIGSLDDNRIPDLL